MLAGVGCGTIIISLNDKGHNERISVPNAKKLFFGTTKPHDQIREFDGFRLNALQQLR
ncbi:MAG: hypothetical protein LBU24_02390 [Methanocalculaceae archaeon]|nr:hypothetical protein [Methanocalculaceae archaeon]